MVKQEQVGKTSSSKPEYRVSTVWGTQYGFPCLIEPVSLVPQETEVKIVDDLGPGYVEGVPGFFISGSLKNFIESRWAEPPHVAFANLLADKPEAAENFTKRYGVLSRHYMDREDPDGDRFTIDSATFLEMQDRLRSAWRVSKTTAQRLGYNIPANENVHVPQGWSASEESGGAEALGIEGEVEEGFDTDVIVAHRYVRLRPKDLWAAVCFLFLWDLKAGKLGFCENPDCPAPFFRKKRKTQKFCEAGPCVAYAQRQYSLDWWNRVGKKRREKKAKAQHRRSKA